MHISYSLDVWRKTIEIQVPGKINGRQAQVTEEHFHILRYLRNGGWDILLKSIGPKIVSIAESENASDFYFVDSFENYM